MARIVDTWNAATGDSATSDETFGIRLVYDATFIDGHTESVSVVVNAAGVWDIYQLESVIGQDVRSNVFQGRWGPRYQIQDAQIVGIAGISLGGFTSPAITL